MDDLWRVDETYIMSLSQNQVHSYINNSLRAIFLIRESIDFYKFEIKKYGFKFWDLLINCLE